MLNQNQLSETELNGIYDIWKTKLGYRVFVQSSLKAQVLNRFLDYPYGKDADFVKSSSEGVFNFDAGKLKSVLNILKG